VYSKRRTFEDEEENVIRQYCYSCYFDWPDIDCTHPYESSTRKDLAGSRFALAASHETAGMGSDSTGLDWIGGMWEGISRF
jgi:hypothetical protein